MIFSSFIGSGLIVFFLFEYFNIFPFFFFSSRRRHTSFDCDGSSDVCSSDLGPTGGSWCPSPWNGRPACGAAPSIHPRSEERRVGKSVDLGGRRIIKKKKK